MATRSRLGGLALGMLCVCTASGAAVINDPTRGARSAFLWQSVGDPIAVVDFGPDDGVSAESGTSDWSFELAVPSTFGLTLLSYNRPSISFDLLVDGVEVTWTTAEAYTRDVSPNEVFHHFDATLSGFVLTEGLHVVTFRPSAPHVDGAAQLEFLPAMPVHEPAAALMLSAGLLWLLRTKAWARPGRGSVEHAVRAG